MLDHDSAKIAVLEDLMEKMRDMDGGRMNPKAVEVKVESVKPSDGLVLEGEPEGADGHLGEEGHEPSEMEIPPHGLDAHGAQPGLMPEGGEHEEPDGDELSSEDLAILDQLFGGKEGEEEERI